MSTRFGFVSTFPPTQCGLATFTAALRDELSRLDEWARLPRLEQVVRSEAAAVLAQSAPEAAVPVDRAFRDLGFTSAALDSKGVPLSRALTDAITDLLAGRRPMSDWEQVVKDWQTNGGEVIRKEYQESIAASA